MTGSPLDVVLIEDNPADAALVAEQLADADDDYRLRHFTRLDPAREHLTTQGADCVLLDLSLPDAQGREAVDDLRRAVSGVPLVVLSGTRDRELMLASLRAGAQDYLVKGSVDSELLSRSIRHAIERIRIGEELRRQQEQSRLIVETATDPFVSVDHEGVVVDWNHSAERVFGWSRAEAVGRPLADTIFPHDLGQDGPHPLAESWADGEADAPGRRTETAARHRSGRRLPVELAAWRVGDGPQQRVYAFIHDITDRLELQAERERAKARAEREQYERRLQQSQRLEALGQLAGGVAHDFNNLLAIITNCTEFVAEDVAAAAHTDPERWRRTTRDVGQIQSASERAIRLTQQLLAFGRRDVAQPEVLCLGDVLTEAQQLLQRAVGEQIKLVVVRDAGLWPVSVDRGQMDQLLLNLAVNARDAMGPGGELTISLRNAPLDQAQAAEVGLTSGRYARLTVTDTGVGMSSDVLDRVFEPFFTSKAEGTGLGLAMVYGVVAQAGGSVRIESEPGQGTSVTVLLPATDRQPQPSTGDQPRADRSGDETVLLVEDEPELREVVRRLLARNGYQVIVAEDTTHAIECARCHPGRIHLLLTDVVMPGASGLQVAGLVAELRPDIRVLYMSGYAHGTLAAHGVAESDIALIPKPFSEAALLDQVRRALEE
ncbi:response regulator [Actinoplanes sp. NPDC049802]|uniref:hybrid sensor histidine kinase/response regulator n=1 Tax=Actinoplanes sp. NPDC049802 TaxID=3154742 RepID=UPI003401E34F